jgi:hypothetical protein
MLVEFENVKSHKLQELVCEVIEFGRKNLFPRYKHININIIAMRNKGVYGDCMYEDDRDFTIRFDKTLPTIEIITTLLHELVHVKQYLHNEEMDYTLPYDERPHEIEAHALEKQLTEAYYGR